VINKKNMDNNNGNGYPKRLLKLSCGRVGLQVGSFVITLERVITGIGSTVGSHQKEHNWRDIFHNSPQSPWKRFFSKRESHSRAETLKKSG
jgi:hypothetical protein